MMDCLHKGFTLIELVMALAIIGILAAIAIPKFTNLTTNESSTATIALASALTAANTNNHAIRSRDATLGNAITDCTDVAKSLPGGLLSGYTITSKAVSMDTTVMCTLTGPHSTNATFIASGIQ